MRTTHKVWRCLKKGAAAALAFSMVASGLALLSAGQQGAVITAAADAAEFETAEEAASNMLIGWNLGNTLDSNGSWISSSATATQYETAWGNPVTTQDMINSVKAQGFNAIRIPVTYAQHIDANGNIDEEWLDRVQEVVDYCMEAGLYCIINVHHDTGAGDYAWIEANTSVYSSTVTKYKNLWTQIATRFQDYDEKLLFEGYNEMLDSSDTWNNPLSSSGYTAVNSYAQAFVDAVRATGGNNATRNLVVNTYAAANNQAALNNLTIPTDTVENHIIMEVHVYDPWGFTSPNATWTTMSDTWDSTFEAEVDAIMARLAAAASAKGVPVIIGEFGAENKDNDEERGKYAAYFVSAAQQYNITCFWWDNGVLSGDGETYGIFDRSTLTWKTAITVPMIEAVGGVASEYVTPTPTAAASTSTPTSGADSGSDNQATSEKTGLYGQAAGLLALLLAGAACIVVSGKKRGKK